jgi:hypothetical protein
MVDEEHDRKFFDMVHLASCKDKVQQKMDTATAIHNLDYGNIVIQDPLFGGPVANIQTACQSQEQVE